MSGLVGILGILLLGVVAYGFASAYYQAHTPIALTLDFRDGARFDAFTRIKENACGTTKYFDTCSFEGNIELQLLLPHDRVISDTVRTVWTTGKDQTVQRLLIISQAYTKADAFAKATALLQSWHLSQSTLSEWYTKDQNEELRYFISQDSLVADQRAPQLQLSLRQIENPDSAATPWFLSIELRWDAAKN